MIAIDTIKHLRDSSPVAELVGRRVYDTTSPHAEEFPYITVQEIDSSPYYHLGGESGAADSLVQIDCWTRDPKGGLQAKAIGEAVRNRMSGYKGAFGDTTARVVLLRRASILDEPPDDASGEYIKRYSMDFTIIHSQAVPDFA